MNQIKNIIFDLGGVLLNIDYSKTEDAFKELGIDNFDAIYSQAQQSDLFDRFESGKITEQYFFEELKKHVPDEVSIMQLKTAWNSMLLDFPTERLNLLKEVTKNYRTFLFSNTNETHINEFENIIQIQHGLSNLDPLFEKVYFSNKVQIRKPNGEAFEFVLQQNSLNLEETIFFDDSLQHIKGAESIGLKSIFVQKPNTILDFFDTSYKLKL